MSYDKCIYSARSGIDYSARRTSHNKGCEDMQVEVGEADGNIDELPRLLKGVFGVFDGVFG